MNIRLVKADVYNVYLHEGTSLLNIQNYVRLTFRYGQSVGEATSNTLYAVGNVVIAGNNVRHLTPKAIAKVTAKSAGKAVVEDYRKSLQDHAHDLGAGPSAKGD
jgi:hypothetical protein